MPLHFAYRPDRLVARPVFRAAHHAAKQLVEHGERGVGQAFLEPDGRGRERRVAAHGRQLAEMLRRGPHCLVG